jgi:hypothetical protein
MRAVPRKPKAVSAVLCVLFAAALSGCRASDPAAEKPESGVLDGKARGLTVLEISGTPYTNDDFDAFVRTSVGDKPADLRPPALSRLFDGFCDEKILLAQARGSGLVLSDEERSAYLEKLRKAMGIGPEARLPAADEALFFDRLLTEKYLTRWTKDIKVEDREVAAYYEAHKGEFLQPEKAQVSQILLDSEGKASTIRERLRGATEDDFRAVARSESAGPEAVKGGIMGVFSPGQLPQELESFILPLSEGEISRVVGSTYGFHIFRLDKRTESRLVSLADASAGIRSRLVDEKSRRAVADHLGELKRTLEWRVFPDRLPFAYQRNDQL